MVYRQANKCQSFRLFYYIKLGAQLLGFKTFRSKFIPILIITAFTSGHKNLYTYILIDNCIIQLCDIHYYMYYQITEPLKPNRIHSHFSQPPYDFNILSKIIRSHYVLFTTFTFCIMINITFAHFDYIDLEYFLKNSSQDVDLRCPDWNQFNCGYMLHIQLHVSIVILIVMDCRVISRSRLPIHMFSSYHDSTEMMEKWVIMLATLHSVLCAILCFLLYTFINYYLFLFNYLIVILFISPARWNVDLRKQAD